MDVKEKQSLIKELNQKLNGKTAGEVIRYCIDHYKQKLAFSTSLGAEDQAITHMIAGIDPEVYIFTLDTGRMFQQSYDVMDLTRQRYHLKIHVFFPEKAAVEEMVSAKGVNLFYESIENRKLCCHVRKIEPLRRALQGVDFWISGLRREQSVTRENLDLVAWDELNGMIKINPLINWSSDDLWSFIKANKVPYNVLHDQGYPSIGCLPCTRAIEPGEDLRAGRWWWENPEMKECGLHR